MSTRKVKLTITPTGRGSELLVDGKKMPNVQSVVIRAAAGGATTVELTMVNVEVDVEGETNVIEVTSMGHRERTYRAVAPARR